MTADENHPSRQATTSQADLVDLRIEGPPAAVERTVALLTDHFEVVKESREYPNRRPSRAVRRYLSILI